MDIRGLNRRRALIFGIVAIVLFGGILWLVFRDDAEEELEPAEVEVEENDIEVIAENLSIPWEIIFLPNEDMLVTERPGTLRLITNNGEEFSIDGVNHIGEGGLLGAEIHPNFEENNYIYLYLTVEENGQVANRVERYVFRDNSLNSQEIILEAIPGARFHNGGRIAFGPDGYLYITTGDAQIPELAQDTDSLAGKILRIDDEGNIPEDNPFGNEVYSYGHRNPQGLVWDDEGRLWATEHGAVGNDEVNRIEIGNNYGWPAIEGDEEQEGMETPIIHSTREDTWAPSGMAIISDTIYFAGLRGVSLYRAEIIDENNLNLTAHLDGEFGRIRTVREHNGFLYIATSNTDGRGEPQDADDRVIRINPDIFE